MKSNYELVCDLVDVSIKGSKIVGGEISSGKSYFEGKKRLCKILKSKKGYSVEINVRFDKVIEKEFGLRFIMLEERKVKKLGSMKYFYSSNKLEDVKKILKLMVIRFKEELIEEKGKKELEEKDENVG